MIFCVRPSWPVLPLLRFADLSQYMSVTVRLIEMLRLLRHCSGLDVQYVRVEFILLLVVLIIKVLQKLC